MTDIEVAFQAIKDTEVEANTVKNNKGVITLTDTKIMLGLGATTLDYLTLLKNEIKNEIGTGGGTGGGGTATDVPIIYQGIKTTTEIEASKETMKNSLVWDSDKSKLVYIKKEQTDTDYLLEIPLNVNNITNNITLQGDTYIAGDNITITNNEDGTKTISAIANTFDGFNIVNQVPTIESLQDATNANKVYFVM